jgi:hypothetical protein
VPTVWTPKPLGDLTIPLTEVHPCYWLTENLEAGKCEILSPEKPKSDEEEGDDVDEDENDDSGE